MKVDPIWFTGHRVYELPVLITSTFGVPLWAQATTYLCAFVLNNQEETLFEFDDYSFAEALYTDDLQISMGYHQKSVLFDQVLHYRDDKVYSGK